MDGHLGGTSHELAASDGAICSVMASTASDKCIVGNVYTRGRKKLRGMTACVT